MNPNISRWATASVAEHLKTTVVDELGLTFFVESVDREQREWFQTDSAVLRVIGPKYYPAPGGDWYRFEVMVMLTDLPTDSVDAFTNHDRLGSIAERLCGPIPVYKYGGDNSQVGCLDIDKSAKEFLRIVQFGKLDPNTEVVQGAVIAAYEICLDE